MSLFTGVIFACGLVLLSANGAESQNFTRQGPSPNPNAPRSAPSQGLRSDLADIEAAIRFKDRIKQRWAERKAERRRAQRGAWDDLVRGRNADRWESSERAYQEPDYPDPRDYMSGHIEPGHIPYNCGHITGNARARADCQRDWEASDPNDYLNYGR